MKIIADEVEGAFYYDIVLTQADFDALEKGEQLQGSFTFKRRNHYLGIYREYGYLFINPEGEE